MTTAVFALGSNGSGQLGIGHRSDVSVPKPVSFSPGAPASAVRRVVAGGGNHALLVTADGRVWFSGDGASSAGGLVPDGDSAPAFRELALDGQPGSRVVMAAATWEASFLVVEDGDGASATTTTRLLSVGTGHKGELGLGPFVVRTPRPSAIPSFPPPGTRIVDLAAGVAHVVAVLSNGEAWGWGAGRKGQLGPVPSSGGARGGNGGGEGGEGEEGTTGNDDNDDGGVVHSPRRIEGVGFAVRRAACGREFTALIGAAALGGEVVVLGSDRWGVRSTAPQAVPGWRDVGAGWGGVVVLVGGGEGEGEGEGGGGGAASATAGAAAAGAAAGAASGGGRLVAWGRADHGQLPPGGLPGIARVAVGSEHCVAVTSGGDVVAWGWGEHGNCGPGADAKGDVKGGIWNTVASARYLPKGTRVVGVAAGCATSWVVVGQDEEKKEEEEG